MDGMQKSRKSTGSNGGSRRESENKLKKNENGGQPQNNSILKYFTKKRSATDAELDVIPLPPPVVLTILGSSNGPQVNTTVGDCEFRDEEDVEVMSIMSSTDSVIICSQQPSTTPCVSDHNNDNAADAAAAATTTTTEVDNCVDDERSRSTTPLLEGQYEVESIMDYEHQSTGDLYLIKWKGYAHEDNTWEPIENLAECEDKLIEFYLSRKNQGSQEPAEEVVPTGGEKRRKRAKPLPIPPDPRPIWVAIADFFNREDVADPLTEELNEIYKKLRNGTIPVSRKWSEKKLRKKMDDASTLKLDKDKWEELRSQAIFAKADVAGDDLKIDLKEWENDINKITGGMPKIIIENTVDLSGPPTDFTYINDYLPEAGIVIPQDPPMGCSCANDCTGNKSRCCPKQLGGHHRGFYTSSKRMQADPGTPIYECNKKCKCSSNCSNRVVQDGVKALRGKRFTIFQTPHCGWGVKSPKVIKKGSFVCMYVGEIISDAEADRRGKTYDQEGSTYLFDLDFNQTDGDDCPYVVDAKMYGNLAHFFNHSCDPNLAVYGVWSDCLDINLPKLALFAVRDIPSDTELTFDYTRSQEHRAEAEPLNLPPIKTKECRCGSSNCRQFLF